MSKTLEFSELLVTKMCHDLAAPIGAIYNGIEFIESEGTYNIKDNKAYELISSNAEIAVNKIKFFRYIYGKSDSEGEIDVENLQVLAREFFIGSKTSIQFDNEKSGESYVQLTNRAGRLVLILATLAASCMIYGGDISVYLRRSKGGKYVIVEGVSEKDIKQDDELTNIINSHELKGIKLSNIVVHLASVISTDLGGSLHVTQKDKSIKFELELG